MNCANLVIRPFEPADLTVLVALERDSVAAEPRSQATFECMMSTFHELILVAVVDGQIVGYVGYSMPSPPFALSLDLHRIVVKRELRRRRIGQAMLNEVIAISAQHYDCVYSNSVPAEDEVCRQFLLKNEFVDAGALPYQYRHRSVSRRKRDWQLVDDGNGSYKPVLCVA